MRVKSTLPFCSLISLNLWPQCRYFTILPLQNVADCEACEFTSLLPQIVARSMTGFHVHLNYRDDQSHVGKKGRGKKELAKIILMHSTIFLCSWELETLSNTFLVLRDIHSFQHIALLEILWDMHAFCQRHL